MQGERGQRMSRDLRQTIHLQISFVFSQTFLKIFLKKVTYRAIKYMVYFSRSNFASKFKVHMRFCSKTSIFGFSGTQNRNKLCCEIALEPLPRSLSNPTSQNNRPMLSRHSQPIKNL